MDWFIAGINGEKDTKKINIDLSFISKDCTAVYIGDKESSKGVKLEQIELKAQHQTTVILQPNRGFIIKVSAKK
jgi:hypothetical protein